MANYTSNPCIVGRTAGNSSSKSSLNTGCFQDARVEAFLRTTHFVYDLHTHTAGSKLRREAGSATTKGHTSAVVGVVCARDGQVRSLA